MRTTVLPYVDEHAVEVAAGPGDVWRALLDSLDGLSSRAATTRYARLVGCADVTASGPRPLAEGSAVPGFHVVGADRGRELVLEGRHRFSTYALTFRVDEVGPGRSRLRAETRAAFPGAAGAVYRLLVITSRGHTVGTRRLLAGIRHRAERTVGSVA